MRAWTRSAPVFAACLYGVLLAGPAQAASAVALILDTSGGMEPAVEPFSELSANDSVTLADGASITFLHYGKCEEVVVRDGTVVMTEQRYLSQKGTVVSVTRTKCPRKVTLAGEARTGGVRLRAGGAALKLSPTPSFVLTGDHRTDVTEVVVRHDGNEVARHPVSGARFTWPAAATALAPGDGYSLAFARRDGGLGEAVDFDVRNGEQGLALIEVQ